jgi:hypothetical protein
MVDMREPGQRSAARAALIRINARMGVFVAV